jgi:hypothetical protein
VPSRPRRKLERKINMNSEFFNSTGTPSKSFIKPVGSANSKLKNFKLPTIRNFRKLGAGFGLVLGILVLLFTIVYFVALRPAVSLLSNVKTLNTNVSNMKEAAAQRDLVALSTYLDKTETDLKKLQRDRDQKIGWAKNFGPTRDYYTDSDSFINAGFQLIEAGRETITLIIPFADAGGFKVSEDQEVNDTGLAEAFSTWVGIMPQIANDIDPVLEKLTLAGEELSKVDASRYPESFRGQPIRPVIESSQRALVQVNEAGPDIKEALTIIPTLLGVNAPERRYMVMMQNDKEIRATGGFWTYFSTFRINNALLTSDFSSYGTYNVDFTLDVIDPYYTFPTVPSAYMNHLKVQRMFARDANISPDLPTAIDQYMLFWNLAMPLNSAQFKPFDGMFTIDTVVLEEMMEISGPVTLNGVTYTHETVTLELEKITNLTLREQADRKKILGDLMQEMLINVFESDSNLWPLIADKAIDLTRRKHIQGWVFDARAQQLLEKYNYAGRIVDPVEDDYAYWVSTNLGGGKTNSWFVNKEVNHTLEREGDRWVRTVNAKYTYDTALQDLHPDYRLFVTRYQDWVRLYVPLGSELISVEGSDDVTGTGVERNKTYFHGYITVAPGATKELTFKYYLPANTVTDGEYKLYIQKQSGIESETHNVTVNGKTETFEIDMDQEITITL